jgi:hypothetical protein
MQGAHSHHRRARGLGRLSFAGAALCVLAAVALPAPRADAAPSGLIAMNPANNSLNINDTVAMTLDVYGGANIHEVHIGISYNASVVQVLDADAGAAGVQILAGPFPGTDGVDGTELQNTVSGGIINYQFAQRPMRWRERHVATVTFKAIANGNANLHGPRSSSSTAAWHDDGQRLGGDHRRAGRADEHDAATATPADTANADRQPAATGNGDGHRDEHGHRRGYEHADADRPATATTARRTPSPTVGDDHDGTSTSTRRSR